MESLREEPAAPRPKGAGARGAVQTISDRLIDDVAERFRTNQQLRRSLPGWGRISLDRQLPFLFAYRRRDTPDPGTHRLVVGEAAYVRVSAEAAKRRDAARLVTRVADVGVELFGAYLVVELWSAHRQHARPELEAVQQPGFRVVHRAPPELEATVDTLAEALGRIRIRGRSAMVSVVRASSVAPPGCSPLLTTRKGVAPAAHVIGVEVSPVYQTTDGTTFPLVLRDLHRGLSRALKKTVFQFGRARTTHRPAHYSSLGRSALVKAVWDTDRQLAAISDRFDFILSVTPVNTRQVWNAFRRSGFEKLPRLHYRPLTVAPGQVKRELFSIPVDRIEDPELAWLFRQKQHELDRELTALFDRDTPRFRYGSLQLYGPVDDRLHQDAISLLEQLPSRVRSRRPDKVDARAFAARARDELAYFRQQAAGVEGRVAIRDDISGLIVSKGGLNVPADLSIPAARLEPLIQHEVGTHVLTHINGSAQPFRQLHAGLAGYDELQEGVAVLAEHLVGGLTPARLRLLAARVAAVRLMLDGATFVDTFRELDRRHDFNQQTAFAVTLRVFRGGGLTKDAAYLRGLTSVLAFLQGGGELETLLIGKIGFEHLGLVRELLRRKVLRTPPLKPRYLSDPGAIARLRELALPGTTLVNLVTERSGT